MRRSRHGITDFLSLINLENSICDYLNAGACSFFGRGDRAVAGITLLAREASLAWASLLLLRTKTAAASRRTPRLDCGAGGFWAWRFIPGRGLLVRGIRGRWGLGLLVRLGGCRRRLTRRLVGCGRLDVLGPGARTLARRKLVPG